jgi:hypothetical protein
VLESQEYCSRIRKTKKKISIKELCKKTPAKGLQQAPGTEQMRKTVTAHHSPTFKPNQ